MLKAHYQKSVRARRMSGLLLAGAAIGLAAVPQVAAAQDQANSEPQSDETNARGMDEILVTATRREERAQEVPVFVTALGSDALRERAVTQLQDLQATVPSLVVGANGQSSRDVMSPSIRGQTTSFQGSPAVVVYMNEVPLVAAVTLSGQGGPGNFVDLQNVQVLAGVQGTLFGRNTTGGAILLTPATPTDQLEGFAQIGFGNYNMIETEAAINIPISDKVRLRIAGGSRYRDGFTRDVVSNKDRDDQNWRMGRIGLWIEPVEGLTNYTMLQYGRSSTDGTGVVAQNFNTERFVALAQRPIPVGGGVVLPLGAIAPNFNFCGAGTGPADCSFYEDLLARQDELGNRQVAHDVDAFARLESLAITNTTEVDLTDTLKLRNIFSYSTLESFYSNDQDGTIAPVYNVGLNGFSNTVPRDSYKQITEELQLQGSALDDKMTYTAGGFFFRQSPNGRMQNFSTNVCANETVLNCPSGSQVYSVTTESKAIYAQGTIDFGVFSPGLDRLRLTAGIRYTWDTVEGALAGWQFVNEPENATQCSWRRGPIGEGGPEVGCRFEANIDSSAATWNVGLDYRPSDNVMVYANIKRGYKGGGFNQFAVFEDTRTFGPEFVTEYEAGIKSDFDTGGVRGRLNVNGFWLDYSSIQRAAGDFNVATGGNGAITLSSASADIRGIEVEAMIQPASGIELGANYSYLDASYRSFTFDSSAGVYDCTSQNRTELVFAGADMSCRPLQFISPNIVSVYGRFDIPMAPSAGEMSLFVSYNWTDKQFTAPFSLELFPDGTPNEPGVLLPSFGLLNVSLDWRNFLGSDLDASLFATNLTDETYLISNTGVFQTIGAQAVIFGEPRMFGARLRYNF